MTHFVTGATAAAVLALVVGGCGTNQASARRDFRAQADRICAQGNTAVRVDTDAMKKAQRGRDPDKVFRALARLTQDAAQTYLRFVNRLDALTPPASDHDKIKGWIAAQRRQLTLVVQLSSAYGAHSPVRISMLSEQIDTLTQANNAFARSYGLLECAKSS